MTDGLQTLVEQIFVGDRFSDVLLRLDVDGGWSPRVVVGGVHFACRVYKFRVSLKYLRIHLLDLFSFRSTQRPQGVLKVMRPKTWCFVWSTDIVKSCHCSGVTKNVGDERLS